MYIGKAAQLSGATIKCIRHYETIGLLPPARRQGRYRVYDQRSVELLALIKCAQKLGFTLKEMQALMQGDSSAPRERLRLAIAVKQTQLQARIDSLQAQFDGLREFEASLEQLPDDCYALYPMPR
ncbi:MerR family transcriptional regulator [Pseudomonas aegrilactucae]|uniref:MerR family transcriptional regulator n=1 Tax=Pseudomonas aegrilactucae TaxID=2854028 RepID=A0A9Q2XK21_9PSED|nr:MerR family transcriptional regulator [Pseudomonas aegrilactucae]MBV6287546.1 MerR family transcriptional regulator [Pseudomonas aegrilactucae]